MAKLGKVERALETIEARVGERISEPSRRIAISRLEVRKPADLDAGADRYTMALRTGAATPGALDDMLHYLGTTVATPEDGVVVTSVRMEADVHVYQQTGEVPIGDGKLGKLPPYQTRPPAQVEYL